MRIQQSKDFSSHYSMRGEAFGVRQLAAALLFMIKAAANSRTTPKAPCGRKKIMGRDFCYEPLVLAN
jgi:hypothetical protein